MRHVFSSLFLLAVSMPAFASVDNGLLALAPSGAKIISGVDVNRAKSSPFGEYILEKMNADDQGLREMTQATGFDPRRDVEDVLFASTGPGAEGNHGGFAVLVRGNFDQNRIKATLRTKGATLQPYEGVDVLIDKSSDGRNAFAFLDVDIAAMGDLASVRQMITNRATPSALDPALQQLVQSAGPNHDAWFASLGAGPVLANGFRRNTGEGIDPAALQSIVQSSGGVSFGDIVQLSLDAVARSAKDATSLVDVVRFAASMMQMQRQQNTGANMLASSLDNMTLKTEGSTVHIALSVPETSLEQLADSKGQQHRGAPGSKPGFKPTNPSQQ